MRHARLFPPGAAQELMTVEAAWAEFGPVDRSLLLRAALLKFEESRAPLDEEGVDPNGLANLPAVIWDPVYATRDGRVGSTFIDLVTGVVTDEPRWESMRYAGAKSELQDVDRMLLDFAAAMFQHGWAARPRPGAVSARDRLVFPAARVARYARREFEAAGRYNLNNGCDPSESFGLFDRVPDILRRAGFDAPARVRPTKAGVAGRPWRHRLADEPGDGLAVDGAESSEDGPGDEFAQDAILDDPAWADVPGDPPVRTDGRWPSVAYADLPPNGREVADAFAVLVERKAALLWVIRMGRPVGRAEAAHAAAMAEWEAGRAARKPAIDAVNEARFAAYKVVNPGAEWRSLDDSLWLTDVPPEPAIPHAGIDDAVAARAWRPFFRRMGLFLEEPDPLGLWTRSGPREADPALVEDLAARILRPLGLALVSRFERAEAAMAALRARVGRRARRARPPSRRSRTSRSCAASRWRTGSRWRGSTRARASPS